jgi:membrane protease YdiL (CAAX protease family)
MKRLRRKLPPIILSRTIFMTVVLVCLLWLSLDDPAKLKVWIIFTVLLGFPYFVVNLFFDLGYQIEFDNEVIRKRDRGYAWMVGRQAWTELPVASIHTVKRLQASQSMYRSASTENPLELVGYVKGRTQIIHLEPIAFESAGYDELVCLVDGAAKAVA